MTAGWEPLYQRGRGRRGKPKCPRQKCHPVIPPMVLILILLAAGRVNQVWCYQPAVTAAESRQEPNVTQTDGRDRPQQRRDYASQATFDDRYRDESVGQQVRQTPPQLAQRQLAQTIELIEQNYYQPLDMTELFERSLRQLKAATENELLQGQFSPDPAYLAQLRQEIDKALQKETLGSEELLFTLPAVAQALGQSSEKAGLGPSWPAIELAYDLTSNLDQYSYMLSPRQYQGLRDRLAGSYVGVGVDLIFEEDYPRVFDVVGTSAADRAGIKSGDTLVRIDGISCMGESVAVISKRLTGAADTKVALTVERDRKLSEYAVRRELITAASVRNIQCLGEDCRVGYMRIASFDEDTALEMRQAIDQLQKQGAQSLLIDLRCNGGGMLTAAVEAVRLFVDDGVIVTVKNAMESIKYRAGGDNFRSYRIPVAILVDQNTASAAEIFTAALQDRRRAIIIGEQTRGKGVIQTIYPLAKGQNAICITTATFLPPSNHSFHQKGIVPDILIKQELVNSEKGASLANFLSQEDPILMKALKQIRQADAS